MREKETPQRKCSSRDYTECFCQNFISQDYMNKAFNSILYKDQNTERNTI
jgi:hypothetical protein